MVMEAGDETAVRESFTRQVGLFEGADSPFARRSDSALTWLEPLRADMIVLDVACGAGHAAELVAPHVRQVVGIDLTPALLASAAARVRGAGLTNVLLQEGSATRLPFLDASFDLVFCRSSLHHFPRPAEAVAEMARVCRPGGRVALSDMVAPSAGVREAFDALHRLLDPSHAAVLLETELEALLRSQVGVLAGERTGERGALPIEAILTEVADRDAVLSALRSELGGGPETGFDPVERDGRVHVFFTRAAASATVPR
jgi:SAM-dependent methyltransferase